MLDLLVLLALPVAQVTPVLQALLVPRAMVLRALQALLALATAVLQDLQDLQAPQVLQDILAEALELLLVVVDLLVALAPVGIPEVEQTTAQLVLSTCLMLLPTWRRLGNR